MGYKFKIYFIEVKCLNRQSTAMSLIIFKNLTHFGKQYTAINFSLFSDGVQLVTVKMEKLFPHSNVSSQETIHHTYQYLKIEKNMHYLFTGVYQKKPTAKQE